MSIEQFLAWDAPDGFKYELIDGYPVLKHRDPLALGFATTEHQLLVGAPLRRLYAGARALAERAGYSAVMATLLFIESSPRDAKSASTTIATAFVDAWRAEHPDGVVDTLDVWDGHLPEFDGASLQAKYAALAEKELTSDEKAAWEDIKAYAQRFQDADAILFAIPMWNWSIPYKLKQLVDVVCQNGLLFDFHEDASVTGKLAGKKTAIVWARGSYYDDGSPTPAAVFDQATPFMKMWFQAIGLDDVAEIAIDKTLIMKPDELAAAVDAKSQEAVALAKRF